jgi:hypothetical protein
MYFHIKALQEYLMAFQQLLSDTEIDADCSDIVKTS